MTVKVKPLVWEDADEGMCTKWRAPALGGSYELVAFNGEDGFAVNFSWGRPLVYWFIQGEPDQFGPTGPKMFPTLDAAKAAAQADFEARALSAIDTTDPHALDRVRREARVEGMRAAAHIAVNACLVPPDGGSPTEEERLVCEEAYRRIMAAALIEAERGKP